ncbi:hypothetical protein K490DRAFT_62378 [Saccharata proteae CBS 121410]|uniref:Uncharacterized protein n=1 Tax=Saccharata proteae CBS 121410 TaxID=1314787 RepID=A0A9P4M1A9_9PEZI|nr:hypothetical protein K490DRAFT_62378 [Saccharata proteae CBS 121410]
MKNTTQQTTSPPTPTPDLNLSQTSVPQAIISYLATSSSSSTPIPTTQTTPLLPLIHFSHLARHAYNTHKQNHRHGRILVPLPILLKKPLSTPALLHTLTYLSSRHAFTDGVLELQFPPLDAHPQPHQDPRSQAAQPEAQIQSTTIGVPHCEHPAFSIARHAIITVLNALEIRWDEREEPGLGRALRWWCARQWVMREEEEEGRERGMGKVSLILKGRREGEVVFEGMAVGKGVGVVEVPVRRWPVRRCVSRLFNSPFY